MVKITLDKNLYHPNGLHDELINAGVNEGLTMNVTGGGEDDITLSFPTLREIKIYNDNEEYIDSVYRKVVKKATKDEDGNVIPEVVEDFDFLALQGQIEIVKASHDKMKRPNKEANRAVLQNIKSTDSELIRGLEDLYEWAELNGFTPSQTQKDRIAYRKSERAKLQG